MSKLILPPEWHRQQWLWIGFPHDAEEWPDRLAAAQAQIADFASAVAKSGEAVRLIARAGENAALARRLCAPEVSVEEHIYGDIWLRDTGPLIAIRHGADAQNALTALCFRFNGWGQKYIMAGDEAIGEALARSAGLAPLMHDWVLEGGALDHDGAGLFVTTRQCLMNPNRNPKLSEADIAARLGADLGAREIIWLGDGLMNDHTDGHVDNLARFAGPRRLLLPEASGADDPNRRIYEAAWASARAFSAEAAQPLELVAIPSPGRIISGGEVQPASYMNFVITNHLVVVPLFGTAHDAAALAALAGAFTGHEVLGLPADAVLSGGGGFHCASQQMPALNHGV